MLDSATMPRHDTKSIEAIAEVEHFNTEHLRETSSPAYCSSDALCHQGYLL